MSAKAPHTGHTFGSVPVGGLFETKSEPGRWVRRDEWGSGVRANADRIDDHDTRLFPDSEPVTMLALTPVEPEPDPAVTHVEAFGGGARITWYGEGAPTGASSSVSMEQLEAIVREGAALLAQRGADPIWALAEKAAAEVATWPKGARADADRALVTPAEDRSKPAPGWSVGIRENASLVRWWVAERGATRVTCTTEGEAVAYTWAYRDAVGCTADAVVEVR